MPYTDVESFTFIENSENAVKKSYDIITDLVQSDSFSDESQPDEIIPKVMCDDTQWTENFGSTEKFDLIVSNMNLHWFNHVEQSLVNYNQSLVPDGMFMSASLGDNTL